MSNHLQKSLASLTEDEFGTLVRVLLGETTWEEYFREVVPDGRDAPPAWLRALTSRLEITTLYKVEQEESGSCSLGIVKDPERGDAWTYTTWTEGVIRGGRLVPAAGSLTPNDLWPVIEADLTDTGDSCLYGSFWCHPDLVSEEKIGNYLEQLMMKNAMERLEGGKGPILREWLRRNYPRRKEQA